MLHWIWSLLEQSDSDVLIKNSQPPLRPAILDQGRQVNLLAPGKIGCNLESVIFKLISRISWKIAVNLLPGEYHKDFTNDYRKVSNIRCTKSPNLNVSRLVLQLS